MTLPPPDVCQALSHPTRRAILEALAADSRWISQAERALILGVEQPALSQHLACLVEAGLLKRKRIGRQVEHSLNHDALAEHGRPWIDGQGEEVEPE